MLPDADQVNERNESNTESGRFRIIGFRLPKPRQPDRHRSRCPPDCFIAIAKKRHILSALFVGSPLIIGQPVSHLYRIES